jgi:hypothetical protein
MAKKKMMKNTPPIIDRVPKHSQQPRSSPPKRRTDFSFFNRVPSSFPNPPIIGMLFFFLNFLNSHSVFLSIVYSSVVIVIQFDCLLCCGCEI